MAQLPGTNTPLYNALSATSSGFLSQRTPQAAGGPPGVLSGVGPSFPNGNGEGLSGPSSPQSPNGDNLFTFDTQKQNTTGYAPGSQLGQLPPNLASNPVAGYGDNTNSGGTAIRPVNQQPFPQPNQSPTMPGLYSALTSQGNQGQPQRQFNPQG